MHLQHFFARLFLLLLTLFFIVLWTGTPVGAQQEARKSLYERIGRYDAIAAMMGDFAERLTTDPQFSRAFTGFDTMRKNRFRQILVEWACENIGGPCYLTHRDMKAAHGGLNLTAQDWQHTRKLLEESINRLTIPQSERAEVLRTLLSETPAAAGDQCSAQ
jgi:hemoglobin